MTKVFEVTSYYPIEKANLKLSPLHRLNAFTPDTLEFIFNNYLDYCKGKDRVVGSPEWRKGDREINVIGIRCNSEISFNLAGETFHNDILVVVKYAVSSPIEIKLYCVTMDPKGKSDNIAHLLEGVYASYTALRPHKFMPGRTAIVQDRNKVLVARTDSAGNVKGVGKEGGFFGINIHDSGGYQNSSMGCTVFEKDSASNRWQYEESFKPSLQSCSNKKTIDYCVINYNTFRELAFAKNNTTKSFDLTYLDTLIKPLELIKVTHGL